uniref:Reverse transcriptase domain-containing protein n=1 Tax=Tanacetum cinerariifolium TaxID=118510 RepID=A0A6L2KGC1_TANCI|nr:reverse transcriptase domain-containing protein [Tanacetum cinerariifolium]
MKAFMERFKTESMHVNGAPECMRISGFMHGITNLDLIKRLNDNIPKTVDEMMNVTTTFLKGEAVVANQSRKKASLAWEHSEASHKLSFEKRAVKFKAPPPMSGPTEGKNKNKFYEFHGDKWHSTDECLHPRKQIEEAIRLGQLSHLINELKQGPNKGEHVKTTKKGDASNKEKAATIFMIQPWKQIMKQRVTQSFTTKQEISFPYLASSDRRENPMMIEVEVEGHSIHRMYVDVPLLKYGMSIASIDSITITIQRHHQPPGLKKIQVVPSTAYGMLKFSVKGVVVILHSSPIMSVGCNLEQEILRDIEETFRTLRRINMKLNPQKYTFGAEEWMFLGHIVNVKGIKACPDKAEAVIQLQSPRTLKEVQSFNGKLESLNRFLSKSTKKAFPFFKTLKNCLKKSKFQWTPEAEKARLTTNASLLCKPGLTGAGIKLQINEKASASLGTRLKETKKTLPGTPNSAFDITYRPKTSICGQVLADFIAERPEEDCPPANEEAEEMTQNLWTLFTDGSSCLEGPGAGLILLNSKGTKFVGIKSLQGVTAV